MSCTNYESCLIITSLIRIIVSIVIVIMSSSTIIVINIIITSIIITIIIAPEAQRELHELRELLRGRRARGKAAQGALMYIYIYIYTHT